MSHLRLTDKDVAERARRLAKPRKVIGKIDLRPMFRKMMVKDYGEAAGVAFDNNQKASKPKASKYKAIRTTVDGVVFHSKKEAARYLELRLMEKAGEIVGMRLQVSYPIYIRGCKICDWRADFVYDEYADGKLSQSRVVEDCKGYPTDVYKLKKKMVEAEYGFKIKET